LGECGVVPPKLFVDRNWYDCFLDFCGKFTPEVCPSILDTYCISSGSTRIGIMAGWGHNGDFEICYKVEESVCTNIHIRYKKFFPP
jgi:hypothetical protein